jgi:hypothetical protein
LGSLLLQQGFKIDSEQNPSQQNKVPGISEVAGTCAWAVLDFAGEIKDKA